MHKTATYNSYEVLWMYYINYRLCMGRVQMITCSTVSYLSSLMPVTNLIMPTLKRCSSLEGLYLWSFKTTSDARCFKNSVSRSTSLCTVQFLIPVIDNSAHHLAITSPNHSILTPRFACLSTLPQ